MFARPVLRTRDALKEPELLGEAQSALWVGQAGGSSRHLGGERWDLRGKRADWEEPLSHVRKLPQPGRGWAAAACTVERAWGRVKPGRRGEQLKGWQQIG